MPKGLVQIILGIPSTDFPEYSALHGKVSEISNDIQVQNNQPQFKIKCTLAQDYLKLKNGYQGKLKKRHDPASTVCGNATEAVAIDVR